MSRGFARSILDRSYEYMSYIIDRDSLYLRVACAGFTPPRCGRVPSPTRAATRRELQCELSPNFV